MNGIDARWIHAMRLLPYHVYPAQTGALDANHWSGCERNHEIASAEKERSVYKEGRFGSIIYWGSEPKIFKFSVMLIPIFNFLLSPEVINAMKQK